jgi:hypothetical protein
VLKELPGQVVKFYQSIGRKPNKPIQPDLGTIIIEQNLQ